MKDYEIVKLGKKEFPMYFGFNALRKFCRQTGTTLNELSNFGNAMSLDDIVELIFCGTAEGHRRAGVEFNMTSDDIADLLDGDSSGLERCMELFGEHMGHTFQKEINKKGAKSKKELPKK